VFAHVHMPSLGRATEWLDSEPLGSAERRGHVVLVDFWTLTCINWLRTEPYIRAWSQAYRTDWLVVIGVHTPEFSSEHQIDRVRQATKERGIDHPVAVDNDYAIWSAFDSHDWPALSFVDGTAASATTASAKDATSNPSAPSSGCSASSASSSASKGSAY
jgi:thiol-disulfide isomerase/thioredoxin